MIPPDEALRLVLAEVRPLAPALAPLEETDGLVLAEAVRAGADLPPFDNSAMDGWACRAADGPGPLPVSGQSWAGGVPAPLSPGTACRITTGAPLPAGADCVVPKELAREEAGGVCFAEAPEPGRHVRRRGEDVREGETLLDAGRLVGPYEAGLLAAQGRGTVPVLPRPRVAVVTSGDELRSARESAGPGAIRDASTPALCAALRRWGCVPVPVGAARDDQAELEALAAVGLRSADALFVTGGVSVGERDLTRAALAALGGREVFWRAAVKPGKPLLFSVLGGKPVWGLPGNPVSSLVTAEVFARPALEAMAGRTPSEAFPERGVLAAAFEKPAALRQYAFCAAAGTRLTPILPQNSGRLSMGTRARALAVLPEGSARVEAGTEVAFRWL